MIKEETTLPPASEFSKTEKQEGQDPAHIRRLIKQVSTLLHEAEVRVQQAAASVQATDPAFRESAGNLLHYLALRSFDMRSLQQDLAALGLSSLGRTEAHVVASLSATLNVLHRLADCTGTAPEPAID